MTRKNRGQAEHAFTFILFVLIAGVVLIFGYKAITGLVGGSCVLDKNSFGERISALFDRYDDFGAVNRDSIDLPCDYSQICFVDSSVYNSTDSFVPSALGDPGMQQVIATAKDAKVNIFLIGDFAEPVGYSEKIEIEGSKDVCFKGTSVNLLFKGQGRTALVEEG